MTWGFSFTDDTAFYPIPSDNVVPNFDMQNLVDPDLWLGMNVFAEGATLSFRMVPTPPSGATYEVRDYWGTVVATGPANADPLVLGALAVGWYILYILRASDHVPPVGKNSWGRSMDGGTFAVVRANAAMPPLPTLASLHGEPYDAGRHAALAGVGRFNVDDCLNPAAAITNNLARVALANSDYLPYDTARAKPLLASFPYFQNGTSVRTNATGGSFPITVAGQTTTVPYNATAAAVQAALGALSNVGVGNVFCFGGPTNVAQTTIYFFNITDTIDGRDVSATSTGLTGGTATATVYSEADGVTAAVNALYPDVEWFEHFNEPMGADAYITADSFVPLQKAFHEIVKAANPGAKVLGPRSVSIGNTVYQWLERFFVLGGGAYCDGIGIHDYNGVNGDLPLARLVWPKFINLVRDYGLSALPLWQTEWGCYSAYFGALVPRMHARWVMLALMVWEQYGLPKERSYYFYDTGAGFWPFPSQWNLSWADEPMPVAALWRARSEELLGRTFTRRIDFGPVEDRFTVGSLYTGGDGSSVMEMASSGRTDQVVRLGVSSLTGVQVVSPFGVVSAPTVNPDGTISVPIENGIPTFVRLPAGVTANVIPAAYGHDLFRGKTPISSGSGAGGTKYLDGKLRSWYAEQVGSTRTGDDAVYRNDTVAATRAVTASIANGSRTITLTSGTFSDPADVGRVLATTVADRIPVEVSIDKVTDSTHAEMVFPAVATATGLPVTISYGLPAWDGVDLGTTTTVDTVIVQSPPSYQDQCSLLDFDLQQWNGSAWVTVQTVVEPTNVVPYIRSEVVGASQVDSFYSDRCVFVLTFAPVTASKFRLYVRKATYGGAPDTVYKGVGGESSPAAVCLRSFEGYNRSALPARTYAVAA